MCTPANDISSVFRSGIFFFEGEDYEHAAHRELIARISPPLKAMMENGMKEGQQGRAFLTDVGEGTFARFLEFAYRGKYTPAPPISDHNDIREPSHPGPDETLEPDETSDPGEMSDSDGGSEPDAMSETLEEIDEQSRENGTMNWNRRAVPPLKFDVDIREPLHTDSDITYETLPESNYFPCFLSHAELYVFADQYQVAGLKNLAADRLQTALAGFELSKNSATSISALVTYVYEHTAERDEEVDWLRSVVTNFCANNTEALSISASLLALLQQGGHFVEDLFVKSHGARRKVTESIWR